MHNAFAPQFVGRFAESHGTVALVGRFTQNPWIKIFMSVWLGLAVLWTLGAVIAAAADWNAYHLLPLGGVAMLVLGILMVLAGKALSRGDVAWLSDVIQRALGGETGSHTHP